MLKKSIFIGLILFHVISDLYSTHIRAGEIIAKRISSSSLTYEFTIIGYTDTGSEVEFGGGKFDFGDGNVIEVLDEVALSSNKIFSDDKATSSKTSITFPSPKSNLPPPNSTSEPVSV